MKIEEVVSERRMTIEAEEPYDESLEILEKLSDFGDVVVNENKLGSNGPVKEGIIDFQIRKEIDPYSMLTVQMTLKSKKKYKERGMLEATIRSVFTAEIKDDKMFSSVFQSYYISGPMKLAKSRAERINRQAEDFIKGHKVFA